MQKLEAGAMFDGPPQIILPLHLARAFDPKFERLVGKTAELGYKVGKEGEMKRLHLRIAGIARKRMMANLNAFVDTATAKKIHQDQLRDTPNVDKFQRFTFQLRTADEERIAAIKHKLEKKGFVGVTISDMKKRTYDAIGILQIGLNLFAFVALIAASFGIINTLVIAVMERTKEVSL